MIMVESISGLLIKIDKKKLIVVIKSSSRFVRFYATPEICAEFKNDINSEVKITFTRRSDKRLQLVTMEVITKIDPDSLINKSVNKK